MAIPGIKPEHDVRAKVRVGKKVERQKKSGGTFEAPTSLDYFVCDDAEFNAVAGDKPKALRVTFPFLSPADNFGTGLEWWEGALLVCYSKGETIGDKPIALRRRTMKKAGREVNLLDGADVIDGEVVGNDRVRIGCPVRACPLLKNKQCKPTGRLQFFLSGIDPAKGVYQIDTHSWNTIENLEATLSRVGDPRGREFLLSVRMEKRGSSHFPVLSLEVADVDVNTTEDVAKADALIALRQSVEVGDEAAIRAHLAVALDITNPGWREKQTFIDRIKEVGVTAAATGLLGRFEA